MQATASGDDGQAAPPFDAGMATEYVRSFVPSPHDAEHAPQSPQLPLQSNVQAPSMQATALGDDGQAAPPFEAGAVTEYVRSFVPSPHDAEHAPQSPQLPLQSTAPPHDEGGAALLASSKVRPTSFLKDWSIRT